MVGSARRRASRKGLPFALKPSDIHIPTECPVLGIPLKPGGRSTDDSPTLDRIYPARGYVPGNVLVVSGRANRIKADATPEEIAMVASFYLRYCEENQ